MEFSIVPEEDQQHFRLLELPPELLHLITSKKPTMYANHCFRYIVIANTHESLHFKSGDGNKGDANTVLCTQDKTYDIRQVSTSNSLYVAQAIATSDEPDVIPKPQLQAIAQFQSTLEVLPIRKLSAVPYITAALPAYTSTGHYSSKDAVSKNQLFANVPLSDAECEQGWVELCCFELGKSPHGVIPSASVILQAWQTMLNNATALGIDLSQSLNDQSLSRLIESDNEWPDGLCMALLKSMAVSQAESIEPLLEELKCVNQVGRVLLEDRTSGSKVAMHTASFKTQWTNLLPEKWRSSVDVKLLEGYYNLENGGQDIAYVGRQNGLTASTTGTAPEETKSTLGAKRKWHDKFRASKKTA